jgi:hypothetical protein
MCGENLFARSPAHAKLADHMSIEDLVVWAASRAAATASGCFTAGECLETTARTVDDFIRKNAHPSSPHARACSALMTLGPPARRAVAEMIAHALLAAQPHTPPEPLPHSHLQGRPGHAITRP